MTQLIFIEKTTEKNKHNHYYWIAQCSCGNLIKCVKSKKFCENCRIQKIKNTHAKRSEDRLKSIKLDMTFSPENMYFWGLFWADGYISDKQTRISIVKEDMDDIINFIPNIEFFKIYNYCRKSKTRNQKPQTTICINNKNYSNFLLNNGYKNKINPNKDIINHKNFYMWIRGFIDGDGCWYFNQKNYIKQFCLSGKQYQDWSFVTDLFDKINVKYSVSNRFHSSSNSHSSFIRSSDKNSIKNIYDYIYQDKIEIGLQRKYNKAKYIIDSFMRT